MGTGMIVGLTFFIGAGAGVWDWFVIKYCAPEVTGRKCRGVVISSAILLSFFSLWLWKFLTYPFCAFLILTNLLLSMAVIDRRWKLIPDKGLLLFLPWIVTYHIWALPAGILYNSILGAACGGLVLFLLWFFSKGSIGFGDVKLIVLCGALSGFPGIFSLLFRSMFLAMLYSVILLIKKKASLKTELPFVPFLFLGAVL